jgi:hypothetical protein
MTETNSSALACEHEWFYRSLYLAGQSFSPNGSSLAITAMLAPLLRKAGCQNVKVAAYPIDWSSRTEDHDDMCKDIEVGFKLMEPFYLAAKVATAEEMAATYNAMRAEMSQDDFCALHLLVSVCGQKPI